MSTPDLDLKKAAAALLAERAAELSSHPDVDELVSYHARELSDAQAEALREHLASCRACGDLVLELDRMERAGQGHWATFAAWIKRVLQGLRPQRDPLASGGEGRSGAVGWGMRPAWAASAAMLLLVPAVYVIYQSVRVGTVPALGSYSMEVHGFIKEMRGAETHPADQPYRFTQGGAFELVLYPQEPIAGDVKVETFLAREDGIEPWPAPVEVSSEGAARIAGRVGSQIALPPGSSELFVAIGRPDALPDPDSLRRQLEGSAFVQGREWAAWRITVSVADESEQP
jgi:Putative zinc-finger